MPTLSLQGFDCTVLCYDVYKTQEAEKLGGRYVSLEELLSHADIVSLHTPLLTETFHLMDKDRWVMLRAREWLVGLFHWLVRLIGFQWEKNTFPPSLGPQHMFWLWLRCRDFQ